MLFFILAALGLYALISIETVTILGNRFRYIRILDEVYQIDNWLYFALIMYTIIMIVLGVRDIYLKHQENKLYND